MCIPYVLIFLLSCNKLPPIYHHLTTEMYDLLFLWSRSVGMITWAPAQGLTGWNQGYSSGLQFRILFQDHWLLKAANYFWLYYWGPIFWLIVGQLLQSVSGGKPFLHDLIHKHFITWAFFLQSQKEWISSHFISLFKEGPVPFKYSRDEVRSTQDSLLFINSNSTEFNYIWKIISSLSYDVS